MTNTTKLAILCIALSSCDARPLPEDYPEESVCDVDYRPITWPLTGGIQTKNSPVNVVPGSHIVLQNVRQERDGEWRARGGTTHDALDDLPSLPMKEVALPGGGRAALLRSDDGRPTAYSYQQGGTIGRWVRGQSEANGQAGPAAWKRTPLASPNSIAAGDYAEGAVMGLVGWNGVGGAAFTLWARVVNKTTGTVVPDGGGAFPGGLVSGNGIRPRAIWHQPSGRLCLVWVNSANQSLNVSVWDDSAGAFQATFPVLGAGATNAGVTLMDAHWYSGATITIVVRAAGATVQFIEFNPLTGAVPVNVAIPGAIDSALVLLPDPTASGDRFVAYSTVAGPTLLVQRMTAAGVFGVTDAVAAVAVDQIAGSIFQAGAGWLMVVHVTTGGIQAYKKDTGAIFGPTQLIPAVATHYALQSAAWRTSTWDRMHYMLGFHEGVSGLQDSFFEMALPYLSGTAAAPSNNFQEPQARLLPLQAGPGPNAIQSGHLPHVQPTATDTFVVGLVRLSRIGLTSGLAANQYAIDKWTATYLSAFNLPTINQGAGATTDGAAFIPAGCLLQSVRGELVSHGLSVIAIKPVPTPGVGGALTAGQQYQHFVVVEVPNASGDLWRSPPSLVSTVTAAAMAGNNQISLAVQISAVELANRVVTVKIYRTKGNGSVFQLVNQRTGNASALQSFTFVDQVSDVNLGLSDFYFGEVAATITPAMSHVAAFGGRFWGITRDFGELWLSKPLQKGFQPEFPGVTPWVVPLADQFGDPTALYAMDDKIMVHKRNALFAVAGDGPDNAGGGSAPTATRLDSDVGSLPGTPVVGTGAEGFFVSERGIYRVDRSAQVDFVGAPVDVYLNQPSIGTPLTIVGGVFSSTANEVRFTGQTSYGGTMATLVYDRLRSIWYVDRGTGIGTSSSQFALARVFADGREIRYTNAGTMAFEGPGAGDDGGTAFQPSISSAWIQAAGPQGRMRVRRARVLSLQPASALAPITPQLKIFWNFDDTGLLFPLAETKSPLVPIPVTLGTIKAEIAPRNQKCTAFRLQLTFPTGATTMRLDQWGAVAGSKSGAQKLTTAERWV